ncbi:MAG: helicase-exonuclease AddAB subunit AddA [Acetatifactor sp.]|nr:helicase-exonuclease AddAB subunit AddA [Acetatifactor sp.]
MAISFTPEQQKVIDLHGCNILVSAAAGSGKTAVLVERIIQMVCNEAQPVDIDRLLIVTFTNAAAAEMRERIAAGITARLALNPESEHIQRQATLLHNAQITTIDSFCLFLLRNHFNEIGLDPAFRIADEGEVKLLEQEVLKELLEESYAGGSDTFRFCVEYFCPGGRESVLERHILNLSRYAASFPWPEEWLNQRKEDYQATTVEELGAGKWREYLLRHLERMIQGCIEKMRRVQALCHEPDGPHMFGELVDGELEQLEELKNCSTLSDYAAKLPAVAFGRLSTKKNETVSQEKRELAKNLRAEVKDSVQGLGEKFFSTPLELAAVQGAACREPVCTLIDLVLDFNRRMAEKKQERKVIDFSDMEHFALDILLDRQGEEIRPSRVALEYRQHFVEILIDEYQDSNLVQEYLLRAVSGEEDGHFNRFMVGDVKQSIYKFRLARPELFLEKYQTYTAGAGNCQRIDLARNFRSRVQVVDAVNEVFSRIMGEHTGGVDYDERAALYPGASYPENQNGESELLLTEKPGSESELGARQIEARVIAAKIKELRSGFQVTDKESGKLRPVRFSDMVILLRSNSGWDEEFKEVLEEEGIPVYITSKTGYFGATEVQELLQFLRVLDNPTQDIPLFGVMKSVFGGFSEEEIALIRSHRKGCSLYEALKEFAGEGTDVQRAERDSMDLSLRNKVAIFLTTLRTYRSYTVYLPIRDLLTKIVMDFDYMNYVTALPAGSKRRANVEMLFTKASDFEKTSYFGLFHFVRYMEQLEKYDVDYGEAELLDENADVVRIMSIHKSKGLEFPVTFVAGLSKRFNMQDVNQSLIVDMDLGLGTDYVDPERRLRNKTLRRLALAAKLKEDSLAEELRVLYVALTRAREKLILIATSDNVAEKWEFYRERGVERLTYLDFMEAGSFLDMLLPVLSRTSIRVTTVQEEELQAEGMKEQLELYDRRERLNRLEQAGLQAEVTKTARKGRQDEKTAAEPDKSWPAANRSIESRPDKCLGDPEALKKLQERLNTSYQFSGLAGLYTKTTVSELKIAAMADRDEEAYHTFEEKEIQPYIPAFKRGEEKVSGTVRGNAYHRVMELLDFEKLMEAGLGSGASAVSKPGVGGTVDSKTADDADVGNAVNSEADFPQDYGTYGKCVSRQKLMSALQSFLEDQVAQKRLSREYRDAVRDQRIVSLLLSPLGYRMWQADRAGKLYREQPFVLGIDASRLNAELPETETVLIQGIIDVFFVEEDGMVLLDYKTDSVDTMEELWNRYETQLDYYQEALQKLMGLPVKERILYSFHLEEY